MSSTDDVSPTQDPNPAANWNVAGPLYVGNTGTGELSIEAGGAVSDTFGHVGVEAGSTGTVTMTGEGSTWTNSQNLLVGNRGDGTLNIERGGTVGSTLGYIGTVDGSTGMVTVTGEGSAWNNASPLYVGYEGDGTLTVEDGGTVRSANTQLGTLFGSGTLNINGTEDARGVLETGYVSKGAGDATVTFDGGILRATGDEANFLLNFNDGDVTIADGGAFLDTQNFQKGVGTELSGVGGLTKLGDGTLTLSSANTYAGGTVVEQGLLQAYVPNALGTGPVSVNQEAYLFFRDSANAEHLTVTNEGYIGFYEGTSAGAASITNTRPSGTHGYLYFYDTATAGNAIITNNNDGQTRFYGSSTADDATIVNDASGLVDISYLTADSIAIGSLSGGGTVNLGSKALMLGGLGKNDTIGGVITGNGGSLTKIGTGTLTLTGTNTYTGDTHIASGTLRIGDGGTSGSIGGDIANDATLVFDRGNALTYGGAIGGTGQLMKQGAGTLTLTNTSTYTGDTIISDGTLVVNGSTAGSATRVESGGKLGGSGILGGVTVADGGTIAPGTSIGTLTVDGDLSLSSGSFLDYELGGPGSKSNPESGDSDRIDVVGNLSLDGTLNLAQSGSSADGMVGFGYYRLMTYGGALTDSGLEIGATPPLSEAGNFEVEAGGGNVDLFIAAVGDDRLQHWQGGEGVWNASNPQWLNQGGDAPVTWAGNHAVFKGEPGGFNGGAISVEGTQGFKGLQFVDDGYVLTGDGALQTDADGSEIRVLADGAEIATKITGFGGIIKTEAGTLILSGDNAYTGGTTIADGTLQISADANLGAASGGLTFNGGTLRNTAVFTTARAMRLNEDGGGLKTDADLTVSGTISGNGGLTKTGSSRLTLSAANSYTGGTTINQGNVDAMVTDALGTGPVSLNLAALSFRGSASAGALEITANQSGISFYDETSAGDAIITNNVGTRLSFEGNSTAGNAIITNNDGTGLSFSGNSTVAGATITNNNGGHTDFYGGSTADDATIFNKAGGHVAIADLTAAGISIGSLSGNGRVVLGSKALTLGGLGKDDTIGGVISGDGGSLVKVGSGGLTLSGTNTYTGGTVINQGTVDAMAADTLGTGPVNVNEGGFLSLRDTASAGNLAITNQGGIKFYDEASAGSASITNEASITNDGAGLSFNGNSTAGTATVINSNNAPLDFYDTASAGSASITNNNGWTRFHGSNTADDATIVNNAGGHVVIADLTVDGIAIGSLSGDGTVNLGSKALMLGGLGKNDTIGGVISGSGSLTKIGTGTLTLTGDNTYTGDTHIASGTLRIGDGGTSGSIGGDIANDATLVFDRGNALAYGGAISGTGQLAKQGNGTLILTGESTYTGDTIVSDGALLVRGSTARSATLVEKGGRLGGSGTLGDVTVAGGGTMAPGRSLGTLKVAGDLSLSSGSFLDYELGGPGSKDNPASGNSNRIDIAGDLSLDGTLNILQRHHGDDVTFGYYRLMTYGGALTDSGLEIGATPPLSETGDFEIEAGGGNVDLFIAAVGDDRLQRWQGGDGIWNASNPQWLNQGGDAPVTWAGNHAVFKDEPGSFDGGAITVEGTQGFKGLQFVNDGYVLTGGGALQTDANGSEIRVLADSAKIATKITGEGGIIKTEAGTLILSGANTYTDGTTIADGTLQVAADANLGAASGGLTFNGGTLQNTAGFTTARAIRLNEDGGGFQTDASFTVNGTISGNGGLTKTGSSKLTLSAANSYTGGTTIDQGVVDATITDALGTGPVNVKEGANLSFRETTSSAELKIANRGHINFYDETSAGDATITNAAGATSFNNNSTAGDATIINLNSDLNFYGTASAGNALIENHAGDVRFHGSSTADGATIHNQSGGWLGIADLTSDGIAIGSLSDNGRVVLGSKALMLGGLGRDDTIGGAISGLGGSLIKVGSGTLTLSGTNSYTGGTGFIGGVVVVSSDANLGAASGALTFDGGTLENDTAFATSRNVALNGAGRLIINADLDIGGTISGPGALFKEGSGALTLNGVNGYTGPTTVGAGKLVIGDDDHPDASIVGDVMIRTDATLGGIGAIGGDVAIDGTLSPGNSPGTLDIAGDLTLGSTSTSQFELNAQGDIGSMEDDLVDVGGDLSLGGKLDAQVAGAGYYRLFDYGGNLTDNSFDSQSVISTTPDFTVDNAEVETGIEHQVNLSVLGPGQSMQFWDGSDTTGDSTVDGGSGIWSTTGTNWTGKPGQADVNGTWNGSVGVFAGGVGGQVTVDGTQAFDTLQFSTDGYVLSGGTLALSPASGSAGTINVGGGVIVAVGSVIADGTGSSLTKVRAGTLILEGANTYTGGTRLLGGTLSVSSNANLGAASGRLTFERGMLATTASFDTNRVISLSRAGRFDVTGDTELGLTGTVSGSGDLIKQGSGTLRLDNAQNAYGNTIVRSGRLIGNADSISGDIANAGTVRFDQASDSSFAGAIAGLNGSDGAMIKRGTGELTLTGTSSLDWSIEGGSLVSTAARFSGDVSIGATGSFSFDQDVGAIYAGNIAGTGVFAKRGTGELTLASDSSGFAGHTDVAGGTLVVGDDSYRDAVLGGTLTVGGDGMLGGIGTVGTTVIASGGTIAPGNSIGTLTIKGDVTFAAGSRYDVEVDPEGKDSDLVHATGTASLDGGSVVHIGETGSYKPDSTYTILTADGGITGRFADVSSNFAFLDAFLGYETNDVTMTLIRNDLTFCMAGMSFNECSTGTGAESTGAGNPVYDAIAGLSAAEVPGAFDQLSGEIHASVKSALVEDSRFVREAIDNRIRSAFGDTTTAPVPVMAYGPDRLSPQQEAALAREGKSAGVFAPAATDTDRLAVWTQGFGSWGSFDGDGNAAELEHDTGGVFIGADALVADSWRLGLLAGYSHSSFQLDDRASSGSSDNYHLGLYGGRQWGALGLRAGAAYTWHEIKTSRSVLFSDFADQLSGNYDAATAQVFGELGYRIDRGVFAFEPFANLAYVHLHTDGFTEDGGTAALTGSRSDTDATFTTIGLRGSTSVVLGAMHATARGTLGWRHAFGDDTPFAINAFAGGDPFAIAGTPIAKDAAVIEAGLDLAVTRKATFGLSYSGQIASDARDHGFKAELGIRF